MVITGGLFEIVHVRTYPPPPQLVLTSSGGHWNTCMVRKQVVRIQPEYLLLFQAFVGIYLVIISESAHIHTDRFGFGE